MIGKLDNLAKGTFGMTVMEAQAQGVCIQCKHPPVLVTSAGKREYQISGMCEPCFDELFAESEEDCE